MCEWVGVWGEFGCVFASGGTGLERCADGMVRCKVVTVQLPATCGMCVCGGGGGGIGGLSGWNSD